MLDALSRFFWVVENWLGRTTSRIFGYSWVKLPTIALGGFAVIFAVALTIDAAFLQTGVVETRVRQLGYEYQVMPRRDAPEDVRPKWGNGDFTLIQTEPAPTSDPSLQVYHVLWLGDRELGDRLRAMRDETGEWPVVTVEEIEYDYPFTLIFNRNKPLSAAEESRGRVVVNGQLYVVEDMHIWTTRTEPIQTQEDAPQGASSTLLKFLKSSDALIGSSLEVL